MIDTLWVLLCSGLVFLMQAGFMCLESGMTRSKNSINVAVKNLADFGLSVTLFWAIGYAIMFGTSQSGWIGSDRFFVPTGSPSQATFFLFQAMFCGTSTTIISGAVAERMQFYAYLIVAAIVSALIYPIFGHWAWNGLVPGQAGGWLENLGFVDFAGSTVVHSVGAWVALATLLIVGARQGRFPSDRAPRKIQGSNMPFSVLGAFLLWFGWIGFNGGSALAFNDQVPSIVVNTMLAGVAGLVAAAVYSQVRLQRIEVEVLTNGAIAGLVAITAGCHVVNGGLAFLIGATGAIAAMSISHWLQYHRIDDAVDAVAIHGGAGAWGTLSVALFGNLGQLETGLNRSEQILIQLLGIVLCWLWSFGLAWLVLSAVNRVIPLRVSAADEEAGLNLSEHHAKTETYDLFEVMDRQVQTQDLSLRVPVEPFTEAGHIATRYNSVMDSLERQHHLSLDALEQLYELTAIATRIVETQTYAQDHADLQAIAQRSDEIGQLAQAIISMMDQLRPSIPPPS
jgi:Amt family ammonium transporter